MLWGNSVNAKDLFLLQKRCIRVLSNIRNEESCRPHFIKLKILTLTSLYILEACKFVRKYKHLYPKPENPRPHAHNLRHRNKIVQAISSKLQMFNKGPYAMSITIYNKIPQHIKKESKYDLFVNKLKNYLIIECPYSLQEFMEH